MCDYGVYPVCLIVLQLLLRLPTSTLPFSVPPFPSLHPPSLYPPLPFFTSRELGMLLPEASSQEEVLILMLQKKVDTLKHKLEEVEGEHSQQLAAGKATSLSLSLHSPFPTLFPPCTPLTLLSSLTTLLPLCTSSLSTLLLPCTPPSLSSSFLHFSIPPCTPPSLPALLPPCTPPFLHTSLPTFL